MTPKEEWVHTEERLTTIRSLLSRLHDIPQRDWTEDDHKIAKRLREDCVRIGVRRYELLNFVTKRHPHPNAFFQVPIGTFVEVNWKYHGI